MNVYKSEGKQARLPAPREHDQGQLNDDVTYSLLTDDLVVLRWLLSDTPPLLFSVALPLQGRSLRPESFFSQFIS